MAIPVLVAFALALVWALVAAADQIRCVDAARAGARAAARSEPEAAVLSAARAAAPGRARVEVRRAGELWRVRVEAPTPGPGAARPDAERGGGCVAEDTVGRDAAGWGGVVEQGAWSVKVGVSRDAPRGLSRKEAI